MIKKNFFELELEGQELILKTDLFKQGMVIVIFETRYYLLGGAEVKNYPYFNFQQNFQKKLLKDLTKWFFFSSDHGFCEENFFASMQRSKNS